VLPLRNQDELTSLLARLSNPSSPDYRQFLSAQQFTDRFGPTPSDYQAVINFVIANGFTVTDQPANRLIVPINGTVAQIEHAFNLSMNVYQHPTEQRQFFSPDREPTLNLSVPVKHIAGMDNFSIPRPVSTQAPGGLSIPSTTGSGPGGSFLASDMRAAYYGVGGTTLTGAGQCVGLAEFVGYDIADVNLTFSSVQQSYTVPVNNVLVDNASPGPVNNYDAEQVLDIVQSIGMAPGLSQVRVYIAPYNWISNPPYYYWGSNSGAPDDAQIFNKMASEDACAQLSVSWGWEPDPGNLDMNDGAFQQMAADGQSLFVASGDYGAYPNNNPLYYPMEDPWVIAVGGTNLTTGTPGGPWVSETAWDNTTYCNSYGGCGFGSGGGTSPDSLPIPTWQYGVANSSNAASTTLRNVPDVAMEGDFDNYVCTQFENPTCQGGWAGTSFAAPRWAGLMALANQQAVATGIVQPGQGLGFLNQTVPGTYSIGESPDYSSVFHIISTGDNNCYISGLQSPYYPNCGTTGYNAVSGYNLATGWGSPNGPTLIQALAPMPIVGSLSSTTTTQTVHFGNNCTNTIRDFTWTFTDQAGSPHNFAGSSSLITRSGGPGCGQGGVYGSLDEWSADGLYYLEATGGTGSVVAYE
jgi:subtilase family serine protease